MIINIINIKIFGASDKVPARRYRRPSACIDQILLGPSERSRGAQEAFSKVLRYIGRCPCSLLRDLGQFSPKARPRRARGRHGYRANRCLYVADVAPTQRYEHRRATSAHCVTSPQRQTSENFLLSGIIFYVSLRCYFYIVLKFSCT